jgi:hypothetical protein
MLSYPGGLAIEREQKNYIIHRNSKNMFVDINSFRVR